MSTPRTWRALSCAAALLLSGSVAARELPEFTELAANNGPSVVNISTKTKADTGGGMPHLPKGIPMPDLPDGGRWEDLFRHFFDGEQGEAPDIESRSLGSGFVIDSDGYILTNNHVVEGAEEVVVRLSDRRELTAEVVGTDPRSDLALLRVNAHDLPAVKIGSSHNLQVGEWVMAIGSPFGFDHSVSVGVVSAVGRALPSESYVPFIQTDVAINPGNSGGPLFNLDGEVVGINSQIYSRTGGYMGLSFAIPIDMAMDVVSQLRDQGYVSRGWLGVLIQDVTRDLAESFGMTTPSGALVAKVVADGPAAKAGLKVGDVIIEFNGQKVDLSSDLPPLVGRTPVGSEAHLKVIREGRTEEISLKLEELPAEEKLAEAPASSSSKASDSKLGLVVEELTAEQRQQMELGDKGVVVKDIEPGPAYEAGVRSGDILLKMNGVDITSPAQFRQLVRDLNAGKSVPLLVQRRSGPLFLALKVPE